MKLSELPFELLLEIYKSLFDRVDVTQFEHNGHYRRSWSLYVLRTTLVCSSWYAAGMEYIHQRLRPYACHPLDFMLDTMECPSPLPTLHSQPLTWSELFRLSDQYHLGYHRHVRQYIFNVTSFLQSRKGPLDSRRQVQDAWHQVDLKESIQTVLSLCPKIEKVHILYDCRFSPRIFPTKQLDWFDDMVSGVQQAQQRHRQHCGSRSDQACAEKACGFLTHLIFTTRDTIQRCPCCAGRGWDHLLVPMLKLLPIRVLELNQVLPSRAVLACLAEKESLHTLVLRGDILIQTSRLARYGYTMSNPPRIPLSLLDRLHTLEIYLDGGYDHEWPADQNMEEDDDDHWQHSFDLFVVFRHIYDLIHPMKQLRYLTLHGWMGSASRQDESFVPLDVWLKLQMLSDRHQDLHLTLKNVPGFQWPSEQAKLRAIFDQHVHLHYTH
ncbi:hypothetical protein DM01DRAFT_1409436 [Hesseltinella vesiculosa]|uniref:F-box domain-containing protein n=1 Tax=Hesseltinella vesiculosa TaxID=101127 RepID=A0A1X2GAR7_9FUNG|nr:hypothetical protein DM01DRAFT_1409436 [Hesseltinella vesiculosa]